MKDEYLKLSPEVARARADRKAIVALESTIISHGLPYPENLETALALEGIVRQEGATPATVAILAGRIRVGLEVEELELLATGKDVLKASRRDIPAILARGLRAATTVSATMIAAHLAGIKVFATGGIGGVHRGAQQTFDVSADLTELAKTPVAVVCAGAKAILDLPLTLEYLETLGVPVWGYQTGVFPAFYTRDSGLPLDYRMEDELEIARAIQAKWDLGQEGGILIANPIPPQDELDQTMVQGVVSQALKEADQQGIRGKHLTPFLLDRLKDLTGGLTLQANLALVKNNARLAARIAVTLSRLI
ncbi:MAG: pseudouridine-5'-phosphate glycosidase [Firmicutes bacterium]|nr:pseudouridine-5'-phosphate glycosidase [Bacillota bacterium]MCL5038539.1 pseudouridine-5'-phosphate glycosidase [Bacillota bacterium]